MPGPGRETPDVLLQQHGLSAAFGIAERDELNQAWSRLDAWPDSVEGLEFGMPTAFVARPLEFGPEAKPDISPEPWFDVYATDFVDLAAARSAPEPSRIAWAISSPGSGR